MQELKFIGIGGAINVSFGGNCAYLKKKDKLLIIDVCEGATNKLLELGVFEGIKEIYIAITHTHYDHVAGLGVLIWYSGLMLKIKPKILYSNLSYVKHIRELLKVTGVNGKFVEYVKDIEFNMDDLSLKYRLTRHTESLKCYGIMFKDRLGKYYYTGDTCDFEYVRKLSFDPKIKTIYTEVATETYDVHIKYEDIADLDKNKLILMHFDKIELYNRVINDGFKVAKVEKKNIHMLEKMLDSCRYVVKNAEHVVIDYDRLDDFIANMEIKDIEYWLCHNPYGLFELGIEDLINFMLLYEAIGFSFWGDNKWTIETELGLKDGSDALLYAMLKYVKKTNNYDFTTVSYEEFKTILKGNTIIPLCEERYRTLVDVSRVVKEKMNGNFYNYIKNITCDKELFEVIINNFNSYKDERTYKDRPIYFYKLAQLLTSDILHLREKLENIEVDYSHLVGCCDYKIPQTLRHLKITNYDEELTKIIDNKVLIDVNSIYEVEIRASMIVVIDYIKKRINFKAIDINDYFFLYGKKIKRDVKPYHLCRNVNY